MTMDATQAGIRDAVAKQAAEWFVAHREGELTPREREAFTQWLRTSPVHVREYLAVSGLARDFGAAAEKVDVELLASSPHDEKARGAVTPLLTHSAVPLPLKTNPNRRRLAFAAVIAAVLLSPWVVRHAAWLSGDYSLKTAHGEQRVWRLADGSVVHLNSSSQLDIRFSTEARIVEVVRGQALFDVTRDVKRPFRVLAGEAEVVAVGTAFDVYRKPDATIVTVIEGRVAVASSLIIAGQQMSVPSHPAAKRTVTPGAQPVSVDVVKATAWIQQQIVFDQERLAEVAAEFNRYSRVPIQIDGEALADLRITGIFNAYDTESFVGFLRRLNAVEVRVSAEAIRVSKIPVPDLQ